MRDISIYESSTHQVTSSDQTARKYSNLIDNRFSAFRAFIELENEFEVLIFHNSLYFFLAGLSPVERRARTLGGSGRVCF